MLTLLQKYIEAESYHNLQPHALLFHEGSGADPNTQISAPAHAESIDYSGFISGNPEVKLGSPIPGHSSIEGSFSPGPSTTTIINDDFNSSLSTGFDWSVFDMTTLDFDHILDETPMYGPDDADFLDAIISY